MLTFQGVPSSVVGVVTPFSFFAAIVKTGRTNMGMDGTSFTIIASAWFRSFVRVASSSSAFVFSRSADALLLQ